MTKPAAGALPALLVAYAGASLLHYAHNAEFLPYYPNLPEWLSPRAIYGAWLCGAIGGLAGYGLLRRGHRLAGLAVLAVYALLGFDGLGHYALAPASAHTAAMNVTIWLETATAGLLLASVAIVAARRGEPG